MMPVMKLKQMRRAPRNKYLSISLLLAFSLSSLSGCNLERFRHEKYSCNNPRLDIYDIIVRHAKRGSAAKITGAHGEREAIITSVNSKLMMIEGDEISLQIDRKTGRVTAQKRNKYFSLQCKPSVFTL